MFDSISFVNPTPLAHADTPRGILPTRGTSQWRTTRFNLYEPEIRNATGFNVWSKGYFSGSENVTEFLEGIDNQIKLLEISSDLSCAYLKGHLLGRAPDWYQIFGSALEQNTAMDFAQLKAELSKAFPAIQNRLCGSAKPQNTVQLLEVLAKFEERYSCKAIRGSRSSDNGEGRGWNVRRMPNVGNNRGNWRHSEVVRRPSNGRDDYRGNYENSRQGNQWFESRNRFQNDDLRFNDRGYQFRNGGQKDGFSKGDQRNKGSSENFSRGDRKQRGRLNVLKVSDVKSDQTQSINEVPVKLLATCMSPVELPYVSILLNETFTKALWDTGAEKSFISEETYRKYFFL
ncbi:uncharacterized protein TNCV_4072501 [Trichonephila clavipes]|uniref:Uncharacterized protein n=1 Tax=Trichonephila clavipes TaxID=2585209 RepID=A0A8X6W8H0_TRICX|nr:uncharacterized protein TNCV_4072501 [Trichonephila clavipes]